MANHAIKLTGGSGSSAAVHFGKTREGIQVSLTSDPAVPTMNVLKQCDPDCLPPVDWCRASRFELR
jgi:hypothetical protein